jgi:hypothetical protein
MLDGELVVVNEEALARTAGQALAALSTKSLYYSEKLLHQATCAVNRCALQYHKRSLRAT